MKRKFLAFVALITATLSLSSCLSSDDDSNVEYSRDTAITAFSLGSLDRWSKTTAGKDTLLKANVTGSKYKFYIDQTTREIYNPDSLPCGARDTAVLATITSKNSSPVVLMPIDKPELLDSASWYSSSDSINFSKTRYVRVYNNEMSAYVTYKIKVNVHQEDGDVFNWQAKAQLNAQLAALTDLKVVALGGNIYVFGKDADGMRIYKTAKTDGFNWERLNPYIEFSADDYKSALAMGDYLYILSNGKVYASTDGVVWVQQGSDDSLMQLIGASSKYLYAYEGAEVAPTTGHASSTFKMLTGIKVSKDQGQTWESQQLDDVAQLLPTSNISLNASAIRSTKNAENLLLVGTRPESGDTIASLWMHTVDYADNAEAGKWNYVDLDKNQPGKLPLLDEVLVCVNDSGVVALGSNAKWYLSKDGGLTWAVDTTVTLPTEFATDARFGFCRDEDKYYWIIRNGYVWKGRFNREGWRKDQTIFE